jgi:hypothetical protein
VTVSNDTGYQRRLVIFCGGSVVLCGSGSEKQIQRLIRRARQQKEADDILPRADVSISQLWRLILTPELTCTPDKIHLRLSLTMMDIKGDSLCVTGRAGATASFNCSLCQAGTYGTGSGDSMRTKSLLLRLAHHRYSSLGCFIRLCAFSFLGWQLYAAC